jgi:PAS domain S-box-containing protein
MERESAAMEATSERAERLANLLRLSHEPMFAWRLQGSIEFWNAWAERLYGFAPDEALGRVARTRTHGYAATREAAGRRYGFGQECESERE